MIPDKYNDLPEHLKLLFEWGDPVPPGRVSLVWDYYLPHGFSDADVPALLELLGDTALNNSLDEYQVWVPLYAWRILGQLKSVEAVEPLINLAFDFPDEQWINSEIPVVLAMIGQPALAPVAEMLLDKTEGEHVKEIATSALAKMAQEHPELREEVIHHFRTYLQSPNPDYHTHNGSLVSHLLDMRAIELIDEIRALYEKGYADVSVAGDIEDVEIEFGLRRERSTHRVRYGFGRMGKLRQLLGGIDGGDTSDQSDRERTDKALKTHIRQAPKVGRNEPCPCGSGKKHKRCCMNS